MPTSAASLKNDGSDRWVVDERQYARRKSNEDAAVMPFTRDANRARGVGAAG
jgi:hypothetical protein